LEIPTFGDTLRALRDLGPSDITDSVVGLLTRSGAVDIVVYLADFAQTTLVPIPDRYAHVDLPESEPIQGTAAGKAYIQRDLVTAALEEGTRVWSPIVEGPEYTGVLALTVPGPWDDGVRAQCEELGMLVGAAITIAARYTDLFNMIRRRKAMSLPASIQWDLLPPLQLRTSEALSTGILEPAYDVGGDTFDHSVTGSRLDVAIMDAMGHGLSSSIASSLAMGSYRHDRREGQSLAETHARLDAVIGAQFQEAFVTGQLAQLDLRSGEFVWVNAGHPPPLLVRGGSVEGPFACRPSRPWGLGGVLQEQATGQLWPGDSVIFYTDGVVEGRSPGGQPFGLGRFIDAIEAATASGTPSDIALRRAIDDVLAFQEQRLRDDATIVWVTWDPTVSAQP
jgi:serine phosphatase RsbU (regulator of sigma subunit)